MLIFPSLMICVFIVLIYDTVTLHFIDSLPFRWKVYNPVSLKV